MDDLEFEYEQINYRCPCCGSYVYQVDKTNMVVCRNTDCRKYIDSEPMWVVVVERAQ